jgi:hypothetical protein
MTMPPQSISPFFRIVVALSNIIHRNKTDEATKLQIEKVISFAKEEEKKEKIDKAEETGQPKVSIIQEAVKADLVEMYNALNTKIANI